MKPILILASAIFSVILLAGCGGGGGGSNLTLAPFAGTYAGTWQAPSQGTSGIVNLVVAQDGSTTGTMTGSQEPGTGTITGALPSNGQFAGQIAYDLNHQFTFQGPMGFDSNSHLSGTVQQEFFGTIIPITMTMTKTG